MDPFAADIEIVRWGAANFPNARMGDAIPPDGYNIAQVYWALHDLGVSGLPRPNDPITPDALEILGEKCRGYLEAHQIESD